MVIRMVLGLLGVMWAGYGAWCFADPALLRDAAGVASLNATGSVDLRATYGGLQIAVGVLLVAGALRAAMTRQVLLMYGVLCAGIGLARLLGARLESEWSGYTVFALCFELGSALAVVVLLSRGGARVRSC
jgi:hypothetical protein